MRKFFTLLLVALCTLVVAAPVAAEDETVYVQYVVDSNYEWEIASDFSHDPSNPTNIDEGEGASIGVDDVVVPYGKSIPLEYDITGGSIDVNITSRNSWNLSNGLNNISYSLNKTSLTIDEGEGTEYISIYDIGSSNYAGDYTDLLTFTISESN